MPVVTCPNCSTPYRVKTNDIDEGGREVLCHKCKHVWMQTRDNVEYEEDDPIVGDEWAKAPLEQDDSPQDEKFSSDRGDVFAAIKELSRSDLPEEVSHDQHLVQSDSSEEDISYDDSEEASKSHEDENDDDLDDESDNDEEYDEIDSDLIEDDDEDQDDKRSDDVDHAFYDPANNNDIEVLRGRNTDVEFNFSDDEQDAEFYDKYADDYSDDFDKYLDEDSDSSGESQDNEDQDGDYDEEEYEDQDDEDVEDYDEDNEDAEDDDDEEQDYDEDDNEQDEDYDEEDDEEDYDDEEQDDDEDYDEDDEEQDDDDEDSSFWDDARYYASKSLQIAFVISPAPLFLVVMYMFFVLFVETMPFSSSILERVGHNPDCSLESFVLQTDTKQGTFDLIVSGMIVNNGYTDAAMPGYTITMVTDYGKARAYIKPPHKKVPARGYVGVRSNFVDLSMDIKEIVIDLGHGSRCVD